MRLRAFLCTLALAAAAEAPSEYQVKAAFLYNFCKFVEWPPEAFAGPGDPIAICVLGESPFGGLLRETVRGKQINGRDVVVREGVTLPAATSCQVVFIPSSESERTSEIVDKLARRPILTVGDLGGGIIGLTLEDNRVRFEVDMNAAKQAHLRLGSQLLRVALRVRGEP